MSLVLLVTATCGWLALKLGQARVVGEIIGGILIGPSVLGRLAPEFSAHVFNKLSNATFDSLSTVGLVLFLFLTGMELDYDQLHKQRGTAVLASALSIMFPFAMGAVLAHSLRIRFAPDGIGSVPFVLFLGIAMSITAFPVLARIVRGTWTAERSAWHNRNSLRRSGRRGSLDFAGLYSCLDRQRRGLYQPFHSHARTGCLLGCDVIWRPPDRKVACESSQDIWFIA